jgi:hypothetical protein
MAIVQERCYADLLFVLRLLRSFVFSLPDLMTMISSGDRASQACSSSSSAQSCDDDAVSSTTDDVAVAPPSVTPLEKPVEEHEVSPALLAMQSHNVAAIQQKQPPSQQSSSASETKQQSSVDSMGEVYHVHSNVGMSAKGVAAARGKSVGMGTSGAGAMGAASYPKQLDARMDHVKRAVLVSSGGLIRTRWRGLQRYKECLLGSELVDWLVAHGHAPTRYEAVFLGRMLFSIGLRHVRGKHEFRDEPELYTFRLSKAAQQRAAKLLQQQQHIQQQQRKGLQQQRSKEADLASLDVLQRIGRNKKYSQEHRDAKQAAAAAAATAPLSSHGNKHRAVSGRPKNLLASTTKKHWSRRK